MDLVIHVGAPKTGTTTLQNWMNLQSKHLQDEGLYVTGICSQEFHSEFVARTLTNPNNWPHVFSGTRNSPSPTQVAAWYRRFDKALMKDVTKASRLGMHTYLISSENFHSIPQAGGGIVPFEGHNFLKTYMQRFFENVKIVAFTREERSLAESYYKTLLIFGLRKSKSEFLKSIDSESPAFNNAKFLKNWQNHFGEENVVSFSYSGLTESPQKIIKEFSDFIGHDGNCHCSNLRMAMNQSVPDSLARLILFLNLTESPSPNMLEDIFSFRRLYVRRLIQLNNCKNNRDNIIDIKPSESGLAESNRAKNAQHSRTQRFAGRENLPPQSSTFFAPTTFSFGFCSAAGYEAELSDQDTTLIGQAKNISLIERFSRSRPIVLSYWILTRYLPYSVSLAIIRMLTKRRLE